MSSTLESPDPIRGVSALVWHHGRALLIRRRRPPYAGLWALPGGRIEPGETPEDAVIREVREETAITIEAPEALRTITIADPLTDRRFDLTVFSARFRSGLPAAGDDAAEARWVGRTLLGQLPVAPETLAVIEAYADHEVDA